LLLNPWPESVFAFEQSWPRLAEAAHLVAVDLPGFGGSERREDASLVIDWWDRTFRVVLNMQTSGQ
jgi:pimeloyl-ACP methyl ester carboxylesterase